MSPAVVGTGTGISWFLVVGRFRQTCPALISAIPGVRSCTISIKKTPPLTEGVSMRRSMEISLEVFGNLHGVGELNDWI